MKTWKFVAIAGMAVLAGLAGILALTNPSEAAYEHFATQQLSAYADKKLCAKAPFGLASECQRLLQQNQAQIQQLVANKTTRINLLLLSIYVTDLSISSYLPAYEFKTIGIAGQFHIYQAEEK
jgi:hypothetical protein